MVSKYLVKGKGVQNKRESLTAAQNRIVAWDDLPLYCLKHCHPTPSRPRKNIRFHPSTQQTTHLLSPPGRDGPGKVLQVLRHTLGKDVILWLHTGMWVARQPEGADLPAVWGGGCVPGRIGDVGDGDLIRQAKAFLDVSLHQRMLVRAQLREEGQTKPLKE